MLRINTSADAGYYLGSASERETPGEWSGILAQELGLGSLDHEALRPLLNNRTPEGRRLTPIDQKNRREGYDLTFSEPKSVSIMEQVAGDKRIGQARRDSVDEIMRLLVEPMATTRKGNERVVTGNLAYLPFDHLLARPVDGMPSPNGHVHVVCLNATSLNGKRNALEVLPIKEAAPYIEAAWHALFASKLKGLGYDIRPTRTAFELDGVSEQIIRKFSPRTATIEDELERRSKTLDEQVRGARSEQELRLLEGRAARLKSPKGKAALGAQIRAKKQPLLEEAELKRDWFNRLTKLEAAALLKLHNRAVLGKGPEPELPAGELGRALASFREAMGEKSEPQQIPITGDKSASFLRTSLDALLETDSRVTEERLLCHALKAGVGEVTLPSLRDVLDSFDFIRAAGQVSTVPKLLAEREVVEHAQAGKIHWVKDKVGGLPDAGRMTFPELLAMVRQAGERHFVIAGDARGQREGQPLKVLRQQAGPRPIGEQARAKKPSVVRLKGWGKLMVRHMTLMCKVFREAPDVGVERAARPGLER